LEIVPKLHFCPYVALSQIYIYSVQIPVYILHIVIKNTKYNITLNITLNITQIQITRNKTSIYI